MHTTTCAAGKNNGCVREHYQFASSLPAGVCRQIAYRLVTHFEAGDLEQAEYLSQILLASVSNQHEIPWQLHAQVLATMVLHAKDHPQEAESRYRQMQELVEQQNLIDHYYDEYLIMLFHRAICLYDLGNGREMHRLIEIFRLMEYRQNVERCMCHHAIRHFLLDGFLALRERQYSQAIIAFQGITQGQYRLVSPYYHVVALLATTEATCLQHEIQTAVQCLEQADAIMQRGYWGALYSWRARLPNAITLAEQYGFRWPVVPAPLGMIHEMVQMPRVSKAPLEIHTLGQGILRVDGREVPDWRRRPMSATLLAFLAAFPQGVSAQQLKMHLWPDQHSKEPLYTAISELRVVIGKDKVITENGIYLLAPGTWLDLSEYERIYTEARRFEQLGDRYTWFRMAAALYRGDFLQGIENNLWVNETRHRYRMMQAWLLMSLGAMYYDDGQYLEARSFLDAALSINPRFDPAIEHLMRLLDEMGERTEAVEVFRAYERRTMIELGVHPSPRLTRIMDRWTTDPQMAITQAFNINHIRRPTSAPISTTMQPRAETIISYPLLHEGSNH